MKKVNMSRIIGTVILAGASSGLLTALPSAVCAADQPPPGGGYAQGICIANRNNTLRETIGVGVWTGFFIGGALGALSAGEDMKQSMAPTIAILLGAGLGAIIGSIVADQKVPECSTTTYPMVMNPGRPASDAPLLLCQAGFLF